MADGQPLRAVDVIPANLPREPTELDWKILHQAIVELWPSRPVLSQSGLRTSARAEENGAKLPGRRLQHAIRSGTPCVYRKPKPGRNGDEVRQGSGVNL